MQEALIGSPSDEDEEEDDANPGGTVEAAASASTNASRPRAMHHTLSSSAHLVNRAIGVGCIISPSTNFFSFVFGSK